jgi:1,3-beta-glucan synthase
MAQRWENFVKDTKIAYGIDPLSSSEELRGSDMALHAFGFKDHSPEGILRTRIWASLRSQTLFRTVSGYVCHLWEPYIKIYMT